MSPVEVRDLGEPEAVVTNPLGATSQVRLAGTVVSPPEISRFTRPRVKSSLLPVGPVAAG